ncbi:MAG: hypothetical protein ACRDT1_14400 [Micromonosporaceae bacterium]
MRRRTWIGRLHTGVAIGAIATLGLAGLAGCGGVSDAGADAPATTLTAEREALANLGFRPSELAPGKHQADGADKRRAHRKNRWRHRGLGKRVLHGEFTISTKAGPRTVLVQRGKVTEVDDGSITVKSADGFSLTWTFGDKVRVLERRRSVDGDALEAGDRVAVAGKKADSGGIARLILIPLPR